MKKTKLKVEEEDEKEKDEEEEEIKSKNDFIFSWREKFSKKSMMLLENEIKRKLLE